MTFQLFQNVAADVIFYLFIFFHFSKKIIKNKHLKKKQKKNKNNNNNNSSMASTTYLALRVNRYHSQPAQHLKMQNDCDRFVVDPCT